jgi:hypothetical protein
VKGAGFLVSSAMRLGVKPVETKKNKKKKLSAVGVLPKFIR